MAVSAASFSTASTPSSTVSAPAPAGTAAGDLLLIWVVSQAAAMTFSVTAGSSGWNAVTAATGQNFSAQLLWKAADSTDVSLSGSAGSYTVTASVLHSIAGIIALAPGASFDPSTPASSGQLLAAAALTYPVTGVTTVTPGDTLLLFAGARWNSGATGTMTLPGGWAAAVAELDTTVAAAANVGVMLGTQVQGSAGATGTQTVTLSLSVDGGGLLVALTQPTAVPSAPVYGPGWHPGQGLPGLPGATPFWSPPSAQVPPPPAAPPALPPPLPLPSFPRRLLSRARLGPLGTCAAGIAVAAGLVQAPAAHRPPVPVSRQVPARAKVGPQGRTAGGIASATVTPLGTPARPQPFIFRSPARARARLGAAGRPAGGIASAIVTPLGSGSQPAPRPVLTHPAPRRGLAGPRSRNAGGIASGIITPLGTPGPSWRPQPRRPAPGRAVWRGGAGPRPAAGGLWVLAQQVTGSTAAALNTPQITIATGSGSLLTAIFARSGGQSTGAMTSVTDSAGNTWAHAASGAISGGAQTRIEIWYALNAAPVAWVQGNSATSQVYAWNVQEWTGATSQALDVVSPTYSGTTATATVDTPTIATTGGTDLVIAGIAYPITTGALNSSGWTALTNFDQASQSGRAAYNAGTGGAGAPAGNYFAEWLLGLSGNTGTFTVSFTGTLTAAASAPQAYQHSPVLPRSPAPRRALWRGLASQVVTPLGSLQARRPVVIAPPRRTRATTGHGQTGGGNAGPPAVAPPAPQAYQRPAPQIRRPPPRPAVWHGNAGPQPAAAAFVSRQPLPLPRSRPGRRAVWHGNASQAVTPLGTPARRPGPQITSRPRARAVWHGGGGTAAPGIAPPPKWRRLPDRKPAQRAVVRRGIGLANILPPAFTIGSLTASTAPGSTLTAAGAASALTAATAPGAALTAATDGAAPQAAQYQAVYAATYGAPLSGTLTAADARTGGPG